MATNVEASMSRNPALVLRAASGAAALLLALPSTARGVRPGLWEHRFQMRSASGQVERQMAQAQTQAQAQLAALPEQRKMMEQMMAGTGMGPSGPSRTRSACT
jgi:hypothetical protein